jgi:hypothetical protein
VGALNLPRLVPKKAWEVSNMTLRFCESCMDEVTDVGGYCLLGHPLKLQPLIPSLAQIRSEIDRALGEVRAEQSEAEEEARDAEAQPGGGSVWESLREEASGGAGDPIEAFAPRPRMDWGPEERARLLRRRQRIAPAWLPSSTAS